MLSFLRRIFQKKYPGYPGAPIPAKERLAPFEPESFIISPMSIDWIYNRSTSGVKLETQRKLAKKRYDIDIKEKSIQVLVKGRKLKGLKGDFVELTVIDNRILIAIDMRPYKDVHAFDLEGNHLWDIEGCLDECGEKNHSFGSVSGIDKDTAGRDILITHYFPVSFSTDLETGKGTKIWRILDDTNIR